jgi:polyphosphate glucokinase
MFLDGELLPNSELGHLILDGDEAEHRAAAIVREREKLSWKEWGKRVDRYLEHVEFLFSPDLFIVGGGVSRKADRWLPFVEIDVEIVAATLENEAGIVGAALVAEQAADG